MPDISRPKKISTLFNALDEREIARSFSDSRAFMAVPVSYYTWQHYQRKIFHMKMRKQIFKYIYYVLRDLQTQRIWVLIPCLFSIFPEPSGDAHVENRRGIWTVNFDYLPFVQTEKLISERIWGKSVQTNCFIILLL